MNQPLISILIPCYNAAPWLAQTLESVLAQTWMHKEIIVVDDGSTDNSASIAHTYAGHGMRLIRQENRGAAAARNHALQHAQGDFIQFLDADDLLAPDKVEQQMGVLAGAASHIAAGPWGRFDDNPASAVFTPETNWRDSKPVEWLALNFAGRGMMPPAAWLTPRRLIDTAGPWDERLTLNDDGEYFCRVLLASSGVRFCANARSFYRSNLTGSLSRRRTDAAWHSAFLSHDLCTQHLLAHEASPRTRRACADLFQRLAFAAYPDCPGLVPQCEAKVRSYGGSDQRPGGGHGFQIITRLLGWKIAQRLRTLARPKTENPPPR
jgi:glycosyltransferase involved in cell wall biosynthesis